MMRRRLLSLACVAGAFSAGLPLAQAQAQTFPNQPITMVVPFPAGGITDTVARALAGKMGEQLGQPVVVSNKPGGGGQIAASSVLQGRADGYTLFVGATEMFAINPTLYRQFAYEPLRDFMPVTTLIRSPLVLVVSGESPLRSVDALVAQAKDKGVHFASQGVGSIGHLLGEQFRQKTGGDYSHIAYRGSSPALVDVMSGQVAFMFDPIISTAPHIAAGKLRPLAIAAPQRSPQLPDVPTLAELGIEDVDAGVWFGAVVKAGTPEPVVERLHAALSTALQDPEIRQRFDDQGMEAFGSSPAEFAAFLQAEQDRWGPLIKASGATVD